MVALHRPGGDREVDVHRRGGIEIVRRPMLKSEIHGAAVTGAELHDVGSGDGLA